MNKKYFKLGYKAFKIKDANENGYSLACKTYPDIYTLDGEIKVFDHSKQKVSVNEKLDWSRGWKKAREEYVKKNNISEKELKALFVKFFKEAGIKIDPEYTNDLYMQFTTGSKAKFNINLGRKKLKWRI